MCPTAGRNPCRQVLTRLLALRYRFGSECLAKTKEQHRSLLAPGTKTRRGPRENDSETELACFKDGRNAKRAGGRERSGKNFVQATGSERGEETRTKDEGSEPRATPEGRSDKRRDPAAKRGGSPTGGNPKDWSRPKINLNTQWHLFLFPICDILKKAKAGILPVPVFPTRNLFFLSFARP